MAATAFAAVIERLLAALTGRTLPQVQADIAAWLAGGAPPAWTLAGSAPAVPVHLDRADAVDRAGAPAILLQLVDTAALQRLDGDPGASTSGAVAATVRVLLGVCARGDPGSLRADAVFAAAHPLLLADPSLGGLANVIALQALRWEIDPADASVGWLSATYEVALTLDEASLAGVLA
jgi:hypothetical protein